MNITIRLTVKQLEKIHKHYRSVLLHLQQNTAFLTKAPAPDGYLAREAQKIITENNKQESEIYLLLKRLENKL